MPWLGEHDPFPSVDQALTSPNGLLAVGADLSPRRLMEAYAQGIFPWFNEGDPLLWWSPDPRMVLFVDEFRVSRSLRRRLRSVVVGPPGLSPGDDQRGGAPHGDGRLWVTADYAFEEVIRGCAAPRPGADGTWITDAMVRAYARLAERGMAHSIEVWSGGTLVGGVYGVALGRMFYGESMFSHVSDASKIALTFLVRCVARWGFELIDCQMATAHLASLGAREIPRTAFLERVHRLSRMSSVPGPWSLHGLD